MSASQFGLVSSMYTLGGLAGALLAGPMSTRYGRLLVLRATTVFFIVGPVAETLAAGIATLSSGRFLSGVGAGAAIVVGPIYISEISPPNARGFFGAFTQVMANVGILLAQTLGYFLSRDSLWRVILAIAGLLGAVELLGLFFVPDSPVWLADHKDSGLAALVLQRIRGRDADIEAEVRAWNIGPVEPAASAESESLLRAPSPAGDQRQKQPHQPRPASVSILRVVTDPRYRRAIIAIVGVMIAQQFTGINSIIMYSVSLLQTILPTTASLLAVIISAINLVITIACTPLPDRIGRKTCLLLSIAGMGCNSVVLALAISFQQQVLAAIASLLFVASFAVGLGPVPFILASELVGAEAVGATQSWGLAANWTATFVVAQFFPVLNDALGGQGRIFWIFATTAVLLGCFIYVWVPETKGRANADEVWGRPINSRRPD